MKNAIILAGLLGALAIGPALAEDDAVTVAAPAEDDEFMQVLEETGPFWTDGELSEVKKNLDYLDQLYSQKRVAVLQGFLPEKLEGWEAEDTESQVMAAAMFGGGTSVSKVFTKGDINVKVELMGDNGALTQMLNMAVSNPAILASSGGEVMRIGREQAVYNNNELQFIVKGWIVKVSGSGEKEDKIAYAKGIDQSALGKFE